MIDTDTTAWDSIEISPEEAIECDGNIRHVTVSGSISQNYETMKIEMGGDVPEGIEWKRFTKYLINQVNWHRGLFRRKMEQSNG